MPTYQKFSSPEQAAELRTAVLNQVPTRRIITFHVANKLHVGIVSGQYQSDKAARKKWSVYKRHVNRNLLSFGWYDPRGRLVVGLLIPTLGTNPNDSREHSGCYITDYSPDETADLYNLCVARLAEEEANIS